MHFLGTVLLVFLAIFSQADALEKWEGRSRAVVSAKGQGPIASVRFNVIGDMERLVVDNHPENPGSDLLLQAGKHTYAIYSATTCPLQKEFELREGEALVITETMADYALPEILIDTNKRGKTTLLLSGSEVPVGRVHAIKRCKGELAYHVICRDEGETQEEQGIITLEPGLKANRYFTFYAPSERSGIAKRAEDFKAGNRLELFYGYTRLPAEFEGDGAYEGIRFLRANYLTTAQGLRCGPGIAYGVSGSHAASAEALYTMALQFTGFGAGDKALHIGTLAAIIPFIGIEVGLGYHEYYDSKNKTTISRFKKKADEADEAFVRDHVIARALMGVDLAFSDILSLQLYVKKGWTMEEDTLMGAGISLRLP